VQDVAYPAALALCEQVTAVQLLDAATITSLLRIIVQQSCRLTCALGGDLEDADGDPEGVIADVAVIKKLCDLPAAALVAAEPLIKLAGQLRALRILPCLCRQLQLSVNSLTLLLQDAAQQREYGCLKMLLASAAAQQLSKESLAQLLESTVGQAEEGAAAALMRLPAALQLEVATVAALLDSSGEFDFLCLCLVTWGSGIILAGHTRLSLFPFGGACCSFGAAFKLASG
jgi:hypothetical protein